MMDIREIMRKAFNLGQTYWQQADSEYVSQQKKSDSTLQKFEELLLAASIDSHQARLQYDALLEALEYCKELLLKYEFNRIDKEEIHDAAITKIDAAIAAAKGE